MVAYAKTTYTTPEEYLYWERKSETKHEYLDGVVVAMAGSTKEHNLITVNVAGEVRQMVKKKQCSTFSTDMRVAIPKSRHYYYPDVAVVCGEAKFEDGVFDTLTNPILIVEVLSESTATIDRTIKLNNYRNLESLRTYVLISQDQPYIDIFQLQANVWVHNIAQGLDAELHLESIGISIPLSEIYAQIPFENQDQNLEDE